MRPLKKAILKVTECESWQWDPDEPHHRLEGVYGSEARAFNNTFNHLCICFDISDPFGFKEEYAEVLDYVDNLFKGIGRRFRKIHLNFWAVDNYVAEPFRLMTPKLLEKTEELYQEVCASINNEAACASAMMNPFLSDSSWSKVKPDLMLIFSRGKIENDLNNTHKMNLGRYRKNIVWIIFSDSDDPDLSPILSIEPSAEKRIISVSN